MFGGGRSAADEFGVDGFLPVEVVPSRFWRPVALLSATAAVVAGVVWVLSFLPDDPLARSWPAFVVPVAIADVPGFMTTLLETRKHPRSRLGARFGSPLGLRGWRGRLAIVVGAAAWLAFLATLLVGGLRGSPEHHDGRYFSNSHGVETEITHDEWLHQHALESRLFAGHAMVFGLLPALYLTQPPDRRPRRTRSGGRPKSSGRYGVGGVN